MGRILIADDHDALRRGLVRGLGAAGHEVEEASNGNLAIEKLHDSYFDVVLSDLKMGGSDGMDVLRTTRALHPTTAVILMTAFGSVGTAVEAMRSARSITCRSRSRSRRWRSRSRRRSKCDASRTSSTTSAARS